MACITDLPEELLQQILLLLDSGPPSERIDLQHTRNAMLWRPIALLKRSSLVSRQFRRILFPLIFSHLRVRVERLFSRSTDTRRWRREPDSLEFTSFVRKCLDAFGTIPSLLVYTDLEANNCRLPDDFRGINVKLWNLIQDYVNPDRLVVLAPPSTLAGLMSCPVHLSDGWAFNIPYQYIELRQMKSDVIGAAADRTAWTTGQGLSVDIEGILPTMFPWHSCTYDEGSSLNNYGTYHYFEKKPPCIINRRATQLDRFGQWLRVFTYTALFPHFDSFFEVISTIGKFRALRHLTLKLAPGQDSTVLNDFEAVSRGHNSLRDCWSEVERCYTLAISALVRTHGWEQPNCWAFSLRALESFESRDCGTPAVQEDIHRLFSRLAPHWTEVKPATWQNPRPRVTPELSKVA